MIKISFNKYLNKMDNMNTSTSAIITMDIFLNFKDEHIFLMDKKITSNSTIKEYENSPIGAFFKKYEDSR